MFDIKPLKAVTFRHLAFGYWANEFGNWFGEIALAVLVFDRTGSALATAALFLALRFLPALVAPVITVRVEAAQLRLALPFIYVLEAILFIGLSLVSRHFSLPLVLILSTADGMLAITGKALTRSITATWLVRSGALREGNALLNLGAMVSSAAGPVAAGAAVAWRGAGAALLADAASFLVTAIIIATAPVLALETNVAAGTSGRLRSGLSVLRNYGAVRRLMVAIALVMMFGSVAVPIEVVFAKQTLHAGDRGYGFLLGAWGAGMILGGAGFAAGRHIRLTRMLGVGTALAVLGYAGLAASTTLPVACIFSAAGGVGNGAGWIAAVTGVQERIPLATQSALMSVLEGVNQVMPAIGFMIGGAVTAGTSPRSAYGLAALGMAIVMSIVALRPIDRIRLVEVAPADSAEGPVVVSRVTRSPVLSDEVPGRQQEIATHSRTLPVAQA